MGICRAPEIAERKRVELVWIFNSKYLDGGYWSTVGTDKWTQLRPNVEENGQSFWVSYHCINCGRSGYKCPLCEVLRCEADIQFTIMGSFPIVCGICRPERVNTYAGAAPNGGVELGVKDDPEVQWAFRGKQGPRPETTNKGNE